MKRLLLLALLVSLPLAMMAQTQHIKFNQQGEFANFSSSDQFSNTSLSVSRTSTTTAGNSATLNFTTLQVASDFSSETFTQIIGAIPASAFTGQNTHDLVLDLDTSTLDPNTSVSQTCTVNLTDFTESCGPAPTGVIHLAFHENGVQRTRILNFNEEIINGSTTTRIHQRSDNSTANMQGTIFGVPFSSSTATVGVNHESSLEVIKQ